VGCSFSIRVGAVNGDDGAEKIQGIEEGRGSQSQQDNDSIEPAARNGGLSNIDLGHKPAQEGHAGQAHGADRESNACRNITPGRAAKRDEITGPA
jgi:hypothetical protein